MNGKEMIKDMIFTMIKIILIVLASFITAYALISIVTFISEEPNTFQNSVSLLLQNHGEEVHIFFLGIFTTWISIIFIEFLHERNIKKAKE